MSNLEDSHHQWSSPIDVRNLLSLFCGVAKIPQISTSHPLCRYKSPHQLDLVELVNQAIRLGWWNFQPCWNHRQKWCHNLAFLDQFNSLLRGIVLVYYVLDECHQSWLSSDQPIWIVSLLFDTSRICSKDFAEKFFPFSTAITFPMVLRW